MEMRARRSRETSPDRAKVCVQQPRLKPFRRVQVVYYLSRNGHLEHPHYMEVSHSPNQHLRLKDVMDRLTVLRGKGMPSLYSWSCKRSYKNGYVWNDLAENDIIYPSEGAEYVLKGSELQEGCTERFQHLHVSSKQLVPDLNIHPKRKQHAPSRHRESEEVDNTTYQEEAAEEEQEEYEDEEKTSYTSSTTPYSRCSRGVSTDELEDTTQKNSTELTPDDSPPPPSTSSTLSDKANESNPSSKRFDQEARVGIVAGESAPSRNSVLLQFIACGGKSSSGPSSKQVAASVVTKKSNSFRKGVVCKSAVKVAEEEEDMISCMSENPRFGNLQSEEKEYFSGSIVESITTEERVSGESVLKRSNSYNEERNRNRNSTAAGLEETVEEAKRDKTMKGKCIPRKKSSLSKQTRK